jgi:hypothetical protein
MSDTSPDVGTSTEAAEPGTIDTDPTPDLTNLFFPTTTKRRSFAYEREVHLVMWWRPDPWVALPGSEHVPPQPGLGVPIDLEQTIHRVVLCPGSQPWFKHLVRNVAAHYGLKAPS